MSVVRERYGDVLRLKLANTASRLSGYDVSIYVFRSVMIDTGFHRVGRTVAEAVSELRVNGVIITHWHEDHAGNAALLASRGIPLLLQPDTEATLRQRPHIQLYRRVIWGHPPPLVGTVSAFEPTGFECVHTPGHSQDHQVVWDAETGTLFSGDLWLGVRARVVHRSEDPYAIVDSLRRAAALRPDRMFDSHRGHVDTPVAALEAKADWLTDTLSQIEQRIRDGWSDSEIVKRVLGGEERAAYVSRGEYSRANLVNAVRRRIGG